MPTRPPRTTTAYAGSILCALTLLSGCGSEGGDDAAPSVRPSSMSSSPTGPSMPPSGRARPTTMSGQVTSTEGGCIVFKDDRTARTWVLVGETSGLRARTAYVLEGVAMDAMDAACPQGLPYHVTKATEGGDVEDLTPLPSATTGSGAVVRLTGVVTAGVEAGCRVLQTDQGTFVLSGAVPVEDGTRVTVSGVKRLDWASTCQQGPVLEVLSVNPD